MTAETGAAGARELPDLRSDETKYWHSREEKLIAQTRADAETILRLTDIINREAWLEAADPNATPYVPFDQYNTLREQLAAQSDEIIGHLASIIVKKMKIEELSAELERVRKDAERLDYLQTLVRPKHGEFFYNIGHCLSLDEVFQGDLRKQIDALTTPSAAGGEKEG